MMAYGSGTAVPAEVAALGTGDQTLGPLPHNQHPSQFWQL